MKHFKILIVLFILTFTVSCGQQKNYITYTVKEGETMRSIAKKLDMKTKDLLRLNPDVGRKPNASTEIIIPSKKVISTNKRKLLKDLVVKDTTKVDVIEVVEVVADLRKEFVLHTVSIGDTFYSLTRYYNVLKSDLLALNPELVEGLQLGAILKIKKIVEGELVDLIYKDTITDNASLKVALLLPFRAKLFDTITPQEIFKKDRVLNNIVTDFYLGAELAIDSLRNQGIQIDLTVIDTEKRNTIVNDIILNNSLDDMDVVIGSIYSDETKKLANNVSAPLVFPLFSKVQTSFNSSRIVKTSPDKKLYKEKLLSHIIEHYNNENIIIVGDSTARSIIEIQQISNVLKQHDSIHEVHQIIPHNGYIAQERFLKMMRPDTTQVVNWVVIATNNKVIASNAINSLISFPDPEEPEEGEEAEEKINYSVKLFGFESIDMVDNNKLAQLGFVFVNDTYTDESSFPIRIFKKQYLQKNKALPSYYAVRGFDVMYDVVMRLASGSDLYDTFKEGVSYRLESKFDYHKRLFSISENNGLFLLEYNADLSLNRLK
jgi:LysM repeat protein